MSLYTRFLKYIIPYTSSIILSCLCALVISACDLGYIHILADTIDALKVIEEKGFAKPVEIRYFHFEGYFGGFAATLEDSSQALRMLFFVIAGVFAFVFLKGIFSYGSKYLMSRVAYKLLIRFRKEMYNRITLSPWWTVKKQRTGDLVQRVINDAGSIQSSIDSIARILQAAATTIVFLTMMFVKSWRLSLLTMIVFPSFAYIINRFGNKIKNTSRRIQSKIADVSSHLDETISGIQIIKSFTAEKREMDKFAEENNVNYRFAMRRVRLRASMIPAIDLFSAMGFACVFGFGCWQVINGNLTTGWFLGYIAMVGMVFKPIKMLGNANSTLQQTMASVERIFYVLDFPEETSELPGSKELPNIKGEVIFRNVSFGYDGGELVLKRINFKASPGETVALVGHSGVGKTTLLNLLPRFYDAVEGDILIDGCPIKEVTLESLRKQIATVPQDTILFNGTVMENILYGTPNATAKEVIEASRKANADDFIKNLPQGYETQIGERGARLSGGEKQRISIARAILKTPKILLLDEATSALDSESEALIQASLANLMKNRTTFVIAHRLSTVRNAAQILVIDKGQIVESGTHQELIVQNGLYRQLCSAQLKMDA